MTPRSGLSVLELLIALAVLALIAVGLSGAMGLGIQVWDRSRALQDTETPVILRQRLRGWIEQASPPSRLTSFATAFKGGPDTLSFVTFAETPFAPDAAALRVQVGQTDGQIVLSYQELEDDGVVLARHSFPMVQADEMRVGYYDADDAERGWQTDWTATHKLPDLIRIEAGPQPRTDWPVLIIETLL